MKSLNRQLIGIQLALRLKFQRWGQGPPSRVEHRTLIRRIILRFRFSVFAKLGRAIRVYHCTLKRALKALRFKSVMIGYLKLCALCS